MFIVHITRKNFYKNFKKNVKIINSIFKIKIYTLTQNDSQSYIEKCFFDC